MKLMSTKIVLTISMAVMLFAGSLAFAPTPKASAASTCSNAVNTVYSYGGYSTCIGNIQTMIDGLYSVWGSNTSGCVAGYAISYLTVDNSFGPKTRSVITSFQHKSCIAHDGIVGRQTWSFLCGNV